MKYRLIILRHGEAEVFHEDGDHARSLTPWGEQQSKAMGAFLKSQNTKPSAVICSDAKRTRMTYAGISQEAAWKDLFEVFTNNFYLAGAEQIFQEMMAVPDHLDCALLVGHNPGWSHAVTVYSGETIGLAPCQGAILELEGESWSDALQKEGQWQLVQTLKGNS